MANIQSGTISADGNSATVTLIRGREYLFRVGGTFNSANVKLQHLGPDASTWSAYEDSSFADIGITSDGAFIFTAVGKSHRVNTTLSSSPVLSWEIIDLHADYAGE